jgi:hypothetical protein
MEHPVLSLKIFHATILGNMLAVLSSALIKSAYFTNENTSYLELPT